jgi:16S rRNA processing protein RimM
VVGRIRGVRGLTGRVRVEVLTDRPEARFEIGNVLHLEGATEGLTIADAEPVADGPGWWLRFRELPDRTSAEPTVGTYLEADVPADELGRDEVYWHEVLDVPVTGLDGTVLGRVSDVYRTGGAEVLIVRGGPHGELDIPNVAAVVHEFAPRDGRIVVDVDALDLEPHPRAPAPRGRRTRRALAAGGRTATSPDG